VSAIGTPVLRSLRPRCSIRSVVFAQRSRVKPRDRQTSSLTNAYVTETSIGSPHFTQSTRPEIKNMQIWSKFRACKNARCRKSKNVWIELIKRGRVFVQNKVTHSRWYAYRPCELDGKPGDEICLSVRSTRRRSHTQRRRRYGIRRRRRRWRNGWCLGVTEAHQNTRVTHWARRTSS